MQKKVVVDRWEIIEKYVVNKKVLDVGCAELVGTTLDPSKKKRWLHEKIVAVAKEVIGVDINKEQVNALRSKGYNIIWGNAETFNLNQRFDVIVAGELIEHLSNPGLFLRNMKKHLKDDGVLIITTPNRFDFLTFLKTFIRGKIPKYTKPIPKHVVYFDVHSLEALASRYGFEKIGVYYYYTFSKSYDSLKTRLLLRFIAYIRPEFVRGFIMVLKKKCKREK